MVLHNYFKCEILWRAVKICLDKIHLSCIQCFLKINLEPTTQQIFQTNHSNSYQYKIQWASLMELSRSLFL